LIARWKGDDMNSVKANGARKLQAYVFLTLIVVFVVFAVLSIFVMPQAISQALGIDRTYLSWGLIVLLGVVAFVCTSWANALKKKPGAGKK
jgi:cytochrome bd-type quinol oxidase subunit 2